VDRQIGSNDKTLEGSTNPLLQEAAREFFERRERAWRPGTVLLLARALAASDEAAAAAKAGAGAPGAAQSEQRCKPNAKQLQLAEIVEMMVTAQVIHDDVLEDMEMAEAGNVAHRMYSSALGNKVSTCF
jgi:geranylgeranyl pyrophosphate synthase